MIKHVFYIITLLISVSVHAQETPWNFYAKYTCNYGGLNTSTTKKHPFYQGNIDMTIGFDTEKANWWKGGAFTLSLLDNHGSRPTADYVSDIQTFSNIEAPTRSKLYELWYEQTFKNFSLKIGQQNINSEFVYSKYGLNFINSSFGVIPSVSANIPVSIFPNTTLGARFIWDITKHVSLRVGIFDGNPGDETNNYYGIKWTLNKTEGYVNMGEIHYANTIDSVETTRIKLGGYYHSADFPSHADSNHTYSHNYGAYLIADQLLVSEKGNKKEGLGMVLQVGVAPKTANVISVGYAGGLCYTGLFKNRNEDVLAIGFTNATINEFLRTQYSMTKGENVIEVDYNCIINDHFSIQPDFQYIINPGAIKTNGNAWVALVRMGITF